EMMQTLVNFSWPGNVRELEHAIESAMNLVEGDMLTKACFSEHIIKDDEADPLYSTLNLEEVMWQTERKFIRQALEESRYNISQTARLLKIPRQTLEYKL